MVSVLVGDPWLITKLSAWNCVAGWCATPATQCRCPVDHCPAASELTSVCSELENCIQQLAKYLRINNSADRNNYDNALEHKYFDRQGTKGNVFIKTVGLHWVKFKFHHHSFILDFFVTKTLLISSLSLCHFYSII